MMVWYTSSVQRATFETGGAAEQVIEQTETVGAEAEAEIDLPALAEAVYALLKHKAHVERERQGWDRK